MPNRWESSGRPLFVKTVYVNGNRHAILSQEDPLLHSRVSFFKKTSRPNSSFSLSSGVSSTNSESKESNSMEKTFRGRKSRGWKDLSSELQDCLVKLRLASNNDEKVIYSSLAGAKKEIGNFTMKRQKWGRGKKKKTQNARERFKENELKDRQKKDLYRYVYNFDYNKRKKNYCFVKISSEPSGVILDSVCDNSEDFFTTENKNLVISAAFHNLVMPSHKTETISKNKCGYFSPFEDPAELYWHNYLTKPSYNSLSERVIQWLDMIKKRNPIQNSERSSENVSVHVAKKRMFLNKNGSGEQNVPRDKSLEQDVVEEVKGEPNVETALSQEKVELDLEGEGSTRETNGSALARTKFSDAACEESMLPEASGWEKRINQEKEIDVDSYNVTATCQCERNRRYYANDFKTATQEFPGKNQKSIDSSNVTRTRSISVRDLSPQQHKVISQQQIIWASDRNIERPQLHIFIPMVPSKDPSEDSLSECEPQITEA